MYPSSALPASVDVLGLLTACRNPCSTHGSLRYRFSPDPLAPGSADSPCSTTAV